MTLQSQAKETSLVSLRSPLHVVGRFSEPDVEVDKRALIACGIGALALGTINPLLALARLIEIGREENTDCSRLLHALRQP